MNNGWNGSDWNAQGTDWKQWACGSTEDTDNKPTCNKVFMHMPGEQWCWNCPVLKVLKKWGWKSKDWWTAKEWNQQQDTFEGKVDFFYFLDGTLPSLYSLPNCGLLNHFDGGVYLCNKLTIGWCLDSHKECADYFWPRQYSLWRKETYDAFCQDFNDTWYDAQRYAAQHGRKRKLDSLADDVTAPKNPQEACRGPSNAWVIKGISGGWMGNNGFSVSVYKEFMPIMYEAECYGWNCVVQKYLEQPLLVPEGPGKPAANKIELRLWVMIVDTNPMIVFAHDEPYFRIACRPYKFDNSTKQEDYAHKTNSRDRDNRYTMAQVLEYAGPEFEQNWHSKTWPMLLDAARASIICTADLSFGPTVHGKQRKRVANTYELFGFDFALDSEYRPWLLEVNKSPSTLDDCKIPALMKWVEDASEAMLLIAMGYHEGNLLIPSSEELELVEAPDSAYKERLFPSWLMEKWEREGSTCYGREAQSVPPCLVSGLRLDGPVQQWLLMMRGEKNDISELARRTDEVWNRWHSQFPNFQYIQ